MPKLILENLPDDVVQRLECEARMGDRKLVEVAAARLVRSVRHAGMAQQGRSAAELLRLADSVRTHSTNDWFTPEYIRLAREDGRA